MSSYLGTDKFVWINDYYKENVIKEDSVVQYHPGTVNVSAGKIKVILQHIFQIFWI